MSNEKAKASALARIKRAPEHMAMCDLVEDLQERLREAAYNPDLPRYACPDAKDRLERIQNQLERPTLTPDHHGTVMIPSFEGNFRGRQSLHLVAAELLRLHHTHAAFTEFSVTGEWKARQVEEHLADFSPELHQQTIEAIDMDLGIPLDIHEARLMNVYVFSQYQNAREVPGHKMEKLGALQMSLAALTGGYAVEAPNHWERFNPAMVHIEEHSLSVTQKEVSYRYGDPSVPGDVITLGRFGAGAELDPIGSGYRMTPGHREAIKNVHKLFHEGHPDPRIGLDPLINNTVESLKATLREGFERARQSHVYADHTRMTTLEERFLAEIGESPAAAARPEETAAAPSL